MTVLIVFLLNLFLGFNNPGPVETNQIVWSPQSDYQAVLTNIPQSEHCEYIVTTSTGRSRASGKPVSCSTAFWVSVADKQIHVTRNPLGEFGFSFVEGDPLGSNSIYTTVPAYVSHHLGGD